MRQRTVTSFIITLSPSLSSALLRAACALMLAGVAIGCSTQQQNTLPASTAVYPTHRQVVVASWYGPGFEGRRTSNGERFHQNAYTAASKTLPLGSHVRVTSVATGRSVVVRINDRGPYVKGRSLDLSHAAARSIGLDHKGVGVVRVTRLDGPRRDVDVATADDVKSRHRQSHTDPVRYAHNSHIVPVEASTTSGTTVSNPVGSWLMSLF